MVSTRGSQQAAGGKSSLDASGSARTAANSTATPTDRNSISFGAPPTMGSRLRKRRRTDSSPNEPVKVMKAGQGPIADELRGFEAAYAPNSMAQAETSFYTESNGNLGQNTPPMMNTMENGQQLAAASAYDDSKVGYDERAIFEQIIDHAETIEKIYHHEMQRGSSNGSVVGPTGPIVGPIYSAIAGANQDPDSYVSVDASLHLRIYSLPILDNLSTQILHTLAKSTYHEIVTLISEPNSEQGQPYHALKALFDHTKNMYSHEPFLSAHELQLTELSQVDTIRKTNLATFVSSVFGGSDVGFFPLNEFFLEIFVPDGGRLLKIQGGIFLELKTQAYISAMDTGERTRGELLFDLFPNDLEARLMARRPGARQLAPSEADFVKRAHSRRDYLLREINNETVIANLPQKYRWENFLRDVSNYLSKQLNNELNGTQQQERKPSKGGRPSISNGDSQGIPQTELENKFALNAQHANPSQEVNTQEDMVEKAARAARIALGGNSMPTNQLSPPSMHRASQSPAPPAQVQTTFQEYQYPAPPEAAQRQPNNHPSFGDIPEIPYHTQSAPTQVLYERARQAAVAKVSPTSRRAGLPSQRRPWSTEEENALMAGLDRVKGPHWSQILAMFGPGGTINETLKDRNQVQLKDKARNLKLFFLKSGIEVPYYLQFVTGELKTRAPAQAAKNEAREREQSAYDDDKAHIEGVMGVLGLANASQHVEGGGPTNGEGVAGENGMGEGYGQSAGDQVSQYAMMAQPGDGVPRQQPRRPQITGGITTT